MSPSHRIALAIGNHIIATATELATCTSWLWSLLLWTLRWIQTFGCFHEAVTEPLQSNDTMSMRSQLYETMFLKKQLDHFEECPIQMTPMLEPVRIVHEDEDARVGQPAHILDLEAANRWLFESPESEARCPFCRGAVLHVQAEPSAQMEKILPLIAEKTYTNAEGVAHKAVRLGDARLLAALSRSLAADRWRDVLLQRNQQGKLPFELVPEMLRSEDDICAFYSGLNLQLATDFEDFKDVLVHSGLSARFAGGCEVWSRQDPSDPKPIRPGDVAIVAGSCVYYLLGSMNQNANDQLLLLRENTERRVSTLCRAPLRVAFCEDGRVPELYEPGLRLSLGAGTMHRNFSGQDVWIGGTPYVDDFVITGISRAAAVVSLEESSTWSLRAVSADIEVQEIGGPVLLSKDQSYKLKLEGIRVRIQPLGVQLTLQPCFLPRRAASRDFVATLQEQIPRNNCELRQNQHVVLVRFQLEQLGKGSKAGGPIFSAEHIGAISSEFSVGRRGASSLVIPMAGNLAASVSRHHCNINLKGDHLVVYDGGSMCGTKLNGKVLGNSLASALPVGQGDVLVLGDVRLRLVKVSPVLQADDHEALASFVETHRLV